MTSDALLAEICEMAPEFSVIIPVHNGEKYVERCINSVLSQSYFASEIIIINDGSSDRTSEIAHDCLASHPNSKVINRHNSGVATSRNIGIHESSMDWIAFLDVDDYWKPKKLDNCVDRINRPPYPKFIHANHVYVDQYGNPLTEGMPEENNYEATNFLFSGWYIKTSTVAVERRTLNTLDYPMFREIRICEDYELFWRILAHVKDVGYCSQADTIITYDDKSLSHSSDKRKHYCEDMKAMNFAISWLRKNKFIEYQNTLAQFQYSEFQKLLAQSKMMKEYLRNVLISCNKISWTKLVRGIVNTSHMG